MQHVVLPRTGISLHWRYHSKVLRLRIGLSRDCGTLIANSGRPDVDLAHVDLEKMQRSLRAWKDKYSVCIIPKSVKGEEAQYLSMGMKILRKQKHLLNDEHIAELENAGMIWSRPKTVESKWFSNFHVAREYLEEQRAKGASCEAFLDPDQESYPFQHETRCDVVEASRWLYRQRELYRKQKLTLLQVHLIKRVLDVKLTRQYSPTRRNKHPMLKEMDDAFTRMNSNDIL